MFEESYENIISEVSSRSIAEKIGIRKGDILLRINGQTIEDIIEYMFYIADEYLEIEIKKSDGKVKTYKIHKEYDEDLGIIFENPIIDKAKSCRNKCIFCFIDQLPPHMRETLYFKDDDSRLSFLQGNFITLTNMSDEDIEKIIKYRISPINVSIHTTDPDLRVRMLNNKRAGNIYGRLQRLAEAGIKINGQIVLCPHVNDGENLDRTIRDLAALYPSLESVAVVPVGVTRFRENLYPLEIYREDTAREVIEQIENWQQKLYRNMHTRFVFLSDEFYVIAKKTLPPYEAYEDFLQIENGVGLMAMFAHEFYDRLQEIPFTEVHGKEITVVTGVSAAPFISRLCKEIEKRIKNLRIDVYPVENHFFGTTITVAGLVTGRDIIKQLKDKKLGEKMIIPESMLKAGETIFLDDMMVEDLERELHVKVVVSKVSGRSFIDKILE